MWIGKLGEGRNSKKELKDITKIKVNSYRDKKHLEILNEIVTNEFLPLYPYSFYCGVGGCVF